MPLDRREPLPTPGYPKEMQANAPASQTQKEITCLDASDPLADQFKVVATIRTVGDQHYGQLKVVRRSDKRTLFPFVGAPIIGPFRTWTEARDAALATARKIIADDLKNPES